MLSRIDKLYLEKLREAGPQLAMTQLQGMVDSIKDMYGLQARKVDPELTGRALDIAVARRIYASDPNTLVMIDRIEAGDAGR
ncbi:MAG: hypothetical protein IT367_13260 [Candidatus Hydrogenedentes bacterium]|nr:hypothetical protein [Candidatus Hydrogenedentota bacterium]